MLGLDDSVQSNLLEKVAIVLCLGTSEVPVFLQSAHAVKYRYVEK